MQVRKLVRFQAGASACGVAIGVALNVVLTRWLGPKGVPEWVAFVPYLLAVGLTYALFRVAADSLVENSQQLRRALLGNRFVEGPWLEMVHSGDGSIFARILYIAFEAQTLRLSGQNFDLNGQPRGTFRSVMVVLDWPVLKYKYDWAARGPKRPSEGYGEICFAQTQGAPVFLQGFFVDLDDGLRRTLWGKRLEGTQALAALSDPPKLSEMIRAFFAEQGATSVSEGDAQAAAG